MLAASAATATTLSEYAWRTPDTASFSAVGVLLAIARWRRRMVWK
jgi:hypothetical protein